MWTKLILRGVGVFALAFVLTSAAMFWLPHLEGALNGIFGFDGGYVDTRGSFDLGSYDLSVRDLTKLSPAQQRHLFGLISDELREKTNAELFQMRAFDDVCGAKLVECWGIESTKVKPFIDAVLSDRQTAETAHYSRAANLISGGSLFVSFLALIFTGFFYRRNRASKSVL
jgi:hypothetical protein